MKSIKKLFLFALPMLLLASCNKNEIDDEPGRTTGTGGDIQFTIGFAPQTRVSTAANLTSKWENGDEIGIFAIKHGQTLSATASANHIHNVKLTYNSAGGGTWTASEDLWWPGSNGKLDFYAYYPYDDLIINPKAIAFNVKADQSATTNYNASELLTAKSDKNGSGWSKGEIVLLQFSHALAMVQVNVPSKGKGFGPSKDLKVTLRNVKPGATLDLSEISTTPGNGITVPDTDNDATDITMYRVEQSGEANYETSYTYRALVPAQDIEQGSSLFRFEHEQRQILIDGPLAAKLEMTAGQAEIFERTLSAKLVHTELITAGTFSMGEGLWAEPVHTVKLTENFYMSKYQITNTQYAAFLNAVGIDPADAEGFVTYNKDSFTSTVTEKHIFIEADQRGVDHNGTSWIAQTNYENNPVVMVTWYGATAYANWVGGTLPTEAQWEYACRAGTTTAFYFGNNASDMRAYGWSWENSGNDSKPVGQKQPNSYGLYDMHGNVLEWCSDWFSDYIDGFVTDPVGPAEYDNGEFRVLRGGSWFDDAEFSRSASRFCDTPDFNEFRIGFRVVFAP